MGTLPDHEIKGRKVETRSQRERRERREKRYLRADWAWVTTALDRGAPRWVKLLFALKLQASLAKGEWFAPRAQLLADIGLRETRHLSHVLADLEARDLVELQRRPGKRAMVRLKGMDG